MRRAPAILLLTASVSFLLLCSVRAGYEDWEEWGESEEKRKEVNMRRMRDKGAVPNVPPPPDMDPDEWAMQLAGGTGGAGGGKLFFVKLNKKLVRTADDKRKLTRRWADMVHNGGLDVQVFPVDGDEVVMQSQPYDLQLAKKFFLKQPECAGVTIDSKTYTRADLKDDEDDDDDDEL